jgi:hypothetical protein
MPDRVILAVKYTPVSAPAQLRKAVGGFLRYIHYRDKHEQPKPDRQVEGMLKYVAHRDRSSSKGLLFDRRGRIDDGERRDLADFVSRSVKATKPQLHRTAKGELVDRRRAVYRFVLSPEHASGLDLHRLTRSAMAQLEAEIGGPVRWIAAEHRNTRHPHVHIVMAGLRETLTGQFRSVLLTRPRLARMKEAVALELQRQRDLEPPEQMPVPVPPVAAAEPIQKAIRPPLTSPPLHRRGPRPDQARAGMRRPTISLQTKRHPTATVHLRWLRSLAARYRWQNQQLAEEERRRSRAEGRSR